MSVVEFLLEAKEVHVFVSLQEDKLTVKGNREALVPEIKRQLADYKSEIIELFTELGIQSNSQLAPTTFSQLRLWFLDQLEGTSVHYNMPSTTLLEGNINVEAIQKALNTIMDRHESLRTTFVCKGNEPYQVIHKHQYLDVPVCDLSHLPEKEQQQEVARLSKEESHKPFSLAKDPMMRWQVLKLSDDAHVLLNTMHHIASDGWSGGVFAKEFSLLYKAFEKGNENCLPPLVIQYADYAHWQRHWLKGEVLEAQLNHWTEQLSGIPSVHNLPLDRPRPANYTHNGNNHGSFIKSKLYNEFNTLCLKQGATLFMGLHAVFSLLLGRYSDETDIVIGTPIANREQPDVAPLIGFFLNTLVFRSDLSSANDFIDLLEQSKATAWDAYANQQVPFEQLVKELDVEPSPSYQPLFQVMMILQNNETNKSDFSESTNITPLNSGFTFAKFEITLSIMHSNGGLLLGWNYNTDLFELSTIQRLTTNFEVLMNSIVANYRAPIMSLPMLNDIELEHCTSAFNTVIPYSRDRCVHELFEDQVVDRPNSIAIISECNQISYQRLNEKANQLARFLIAEGVEPNTLVGVCIPRTLDMIVAVLAILKAGGAYLPMDKNLPQNRIDQICGEANLRLVLTHSEVDFTPPTTALICVCLNSKLISERLSAFSKENLQTLDSGLTADCLAYVIYTSGSTGSPKGVMISHRNLHAYFRSAKGIYEVDQDDRTLQFSSFSFDIFVEEMFASLLSGGALILRNETVLQGGNHFWKFVEQYSVTVISLPTAFWHELCGQLDQISISTGALRLMVVGGESMSATMLTRWNQAIDQSVRLLNTYGPTETTVIATTYDLAEFKNKSDGISIGKAIPNTQCYVLNEAQQVCPVMVRGELYISGESISPGYLNNEKLTKERFVQNPFNDKPDSRLYKTGDKVRLLVDGNLEFIGRIDDQIKIRGFRVELGEVEYQLSQCIGVTSAVILVNEDVSGTKRLIGYIIREGDAADADFLGDLREHLTKQLPDYMIPSVFIFIEQWPLTNNGKLNRKALPEPNASNSFNQKDYVGASTHTEQILVEIWAKLLQIDAYIISTSSNFFALGGHSLLVVRLIAEINTRLDEEITIKIVFERSDIRSLGLLIDSMKKRQQTLEKLASNSDDDIEEIEW